jgi:hypothetical protein
MTRRLVALVSAIFLLALVPSAAAQEAPPAPPTDPEPLGPTRPLDRVSVPDPRYMVVTPNCEPGETTTGRVRLFFLARNSEGVLYLSPFNDGSLFRCMNGELSAVPRAIPVPVSVWPRFRTVSGITLYAAVDRFVNGARVYVPLWVHARAAQNAASPPARATAWSGIGTYCYASPGGANRVYLSIDQSYAFGGSYYDWVYVYGVGQTAYGAWYRSTTISYIARPSGASASGWSSGNLVIVGGTTAPGASSAFLQWGGQNGFPAYGRGVYARIGIWVWTRRYGWRFDYVVPGHWDYPSSYPHYEWCYFA